jgi:hypothetical protein
MNEQTLNAMKNLKILPLLITLLLIISMNGVALAAPPLQGDQGGNEQDQTGVEQDEGENQDDGEDVDDIQPEVQQQGTQQGAQGEFQQGAQQQPGAQQQGTQQQGQSQQAGACAQTYTVQAGDTLGQIANRFLGSIESYNQIFDATNTAGANDGFATLTDPNVITVGQTLCIPAQAGQQQAGTQQGLQGTMQQGQQAGMQQGQQGQFQQGNQQAMAGVFSVPQGMSKVFFENLSSRDLIVDVSNGPTPQSVWVGPGQQQAFVVQPGQYTVMGHQPGGEFGVTSQDLQLVAGDWIGVSCQETGQCQLQNMQQALAVQDQGQGTMQQGQQGTMQQGQQGTAQPGQQGTTAQPGQQGTTQPGQQGTTTQPSQQGTTPGQDDQNSGQGSGG